MTHNDQPTEYDTQSKVTDEGPTGPCLVFTLVCHPDMTRAGELFIWSNFFGKSLQISRNEPLFLGFDQFVERPLEDGYVSRKALEIRCTKDQRLAIVHHGERAAVHFNGTPISDTVEVPPALLKRGFSLGLSNRIVIWVKKETERPDPPRRNAELLGVGAAMREVHRQIERVCDVDVPVLICAETGCGKELTARAIHRRGPRRKKPLVSINLAAIPAQLAATELFGAVRGAYTGADSTRQGFFQSAQGGILFLDEIGEASPELQAMLLRVLESGEAFPVGSRQPYKVDVRLLAATDADLEHQMGHGHFKSPLFHRLSGFQIQLPPMRKRQEDFGLLFTHFATQNLVKIGENPRKTLCGVNQKRPWVKAEIIERMLAYHWPGNIRELRNAVSQMVLENRDKPRLEPGPFWDAKLPHASQLNDVEGYLDKDKKSSMPTNEPKQGSPRSSGNLKPSSLDKAQILKALAANAYEFKATAKALGISRPALYKLAENIPEVRTAGHLPADEVFQQLEAHQYQIDAAARALQVSAHGLRRRIRDIQARGKWPPHAPEI